MYTGERRVVHRRKEVVHRKQEGCTQESRRNVHCTQSRGYLYTGNKKAVQRKKKVCTQEKEGLYTGKVVHRRQEDCTRENRRNVHCTVYPGKMINVLVLQFAALSSFGYAPFK